MPRIYNVKNLSSAVAVVIFSTSLLACGGGGSGGGSDSQSSNNPKPTIPKPSDKCKNATANISGQADLDKDGTIDDCDDDIDGDGITNTKDAKPMDASIASISSKVYQGSGFGYVNARENLYFNAKNQLVAKEYLSSSNPDRANTSEQFTYDNKARLIRFESTRGTEKQTDRVELWVYNQKDQLVEYKVNADRDSVFEKTTAYQYNLNGDITQIVESDTSSTNMFDNLTRTYVYNSANQLEQIKTDESNDGSINRITELFYDNNYMTKSDLYYIDIETSTGNEVKRLYRTLKYAYDSQENVISTNYNTSDRDNELTTYVYDNQKNIVRKTINNNSGDINVIDTKVSYNAASLATGATTTYDSSNNIQDVTDKAEYNSAGFLTKVLVDVSQDGKIDQEITYSYQGSVPLKSNVAPFLNLGQSYNIMPTVNSILNRISVNYTADVVKQSCYDQLSIYSC